MLIKETVQNELVADSNGVWLLNNHNKFDYSEGEASERYLASVFDQASDLSSQSVELESYIKDWSSEYHLTRKRAQLLAGFQYERSMRVLEVGCGCGAITRYLGENFDHVISIEGSITRAHLANQRTRDLDSVSIICAPFQDIKFTQRFDIIFCIGVLEYSGYFIKSPAPYRAAIAYFSEMLTDDGILVVAIENQFGLKYFMGAREDHLGVRFEGIEGYRRSSQLVQTFGKTELNSMLSEEFSDIHFYYPFPDYKIPDCVIDNTFLSSGLAGELVSQMRSRDYSGQTRLMWNEMSTVIELNHNRALDFFSNSFLVIAGKQQIKRVSFPQHAVMFSSGRVPAYSTITRITDTGRGNLEASKQKLKKELENPDPQLLLEENSSAWLDSPSVFTQIFLEAQNQHATIDSLFSPASPWLEHLHSLSHYIDGRRMLDGGLLDAIWANAYRIDTECVLIDQEWRWHQDIPLNVIVIRAIYDFLSRMESTTMLPSGLRVASGRRLINMIASSLGVSLDQSDFSEFIHLEMALAKAVTGNHVPNHVYRLKWFMLHRPSLHLATSLWPKIKALLGRIARKIQIF